MKTFKNKYMEYDLYSDGSGCLSTDCLNVDIVLEAGTHKHKIQNIKNEIKWRKSEAQKLEKVLEAMIKIDLKKIPKDGEITDDVG